ncbi:two-component system response regulator RegA [Crenobacter luteus]|uniref:Two-component system response regulator n=1 Tax=Crenobacter luteus TaxID=1452487 RepID=A0A163CY35_9NEIS|nr:response regulator [Crenobacter luteus]KZE33451.1 two-component system response regulator [Crenobacter luteus]TCP10921.1 two-component system response regulator RegA [Crenobacter luteus]
MNENWLVVDDDEAFAGVLVRSLARQGRPARHAADADTALALLSPDTTHVVLDLNLGGASGLRLLPELKRRCPGVAVLVLTGYASIASAVDAVKLGAVQYLAKPATLAEIVAAFAAREPNVEHAAPAQPMSVRRLTWEHVQRVLAEHGGNVSATARALNMHRRTLQRMLAKRPVSR